MNTNKIIKSCEKYLITSVGFKPTISVVATSDLTTNHKGLWQKQLYIIHLSLNVGNILSFKFFRNFNCKIFGFQMMSINPREIIFFT